MVDVVLQDRAYTIQVVLKLLEMCEREFQDNHRKLTDDAKNSCIFLLLTCLGGMRGFEAVWTDLSMLRYDVHYCETIDDYSAISWTIIGRFKCHNKIEGCYLFLIAWRTKSGIKLFR